MPNEKKLPMKARERTTFPPGTAERPCILVALGRVLRTVML